MSRSDAENDAELEIDAEVTPASLARGGKLLRVRGDTTDDARRVLLERIRRMTPAERVDEGERLCRTARAFMRAGIRSRHPDYSDEDVEEALARLLWGDELYRAAKPGRPLLDP